METIEKICIQAKKAANYSLKLTAAAKNQILEEAAEEIIRSGSYILEENMKDVLDAEERGVKPSFIDRLKLSRARIESMAAMLKSLIAFDDPTGGTEEMKRLPNGLMVGKRRVPLGVIGIIYESRPNVTADAFALCLKSGNAVILRGGSDAIRSNMAIVSALRKALSTLGHDPNLVQLVEDTSRESVSRLMKMREYIDVLIPRGGAGLIKNVVENSTIPVIETGTGNCHIFVDESAELDSATQIIINAKTQRPGVCNACEKLLIHEAVAEKYLPLIVNDLRKYNVRVLGDEASVKILADVEAASEEDWGTEYLDYIIAIKIVKNIDEAIEHIGKYSTGHSEAILTESYANANRFCNEVDSAAVYVNASTRFTDGEEFGYGAEIGISTQKLHARGPMGLKELTTTKYVIFGDGQIRK